MYNMSVYSNDEDKDKVLDFRKLKEATRETSSYGQIENYKLYIQNSHTFH